MSSLSDAQVSALRFLVEQNNGRSESFLPMQRGISHEECQQLVDGGYITSEPNPENPTTPIVTITELGRQALAPVT